MDSMTTKRMGSSASIVQRQFFDESFREECHNAARHATKETVKSSRSKVNSHHRVSSCTNNVWVPEFYRHPKSVTEPSSIRGHASAPSMAPSRPKENSKKEDRQHRKYSSQKPPLYKSSKDGSKSNVRHGYPLKGWEDQSWEQDAPGVLSVTASRKSVFGPTQHQPLRKHTVPAAALKPGRLHSQVPAGPPPFSSPPPLPIQARPGQRYNSTLGMAGKGSLPIAGQHMDYLAPALQAEYQVPQASPPRSNSYSQPVPPPFYEVYLAAQVDVKGGSLPERYVQPHDNMTAKIAKPKPRGTYLESFGRAIGIEFPRTPMESSSDISFACGGARQVERRCFSNGPVT